MSLYDRFAGERMSDIVDLVIGFMAVGFIAVIVVKVFRARNGENGVELVDVDLEMAEEMAD